MKKTLLLISACFLLMFYLSGCKGKSSETIIFATAAEYPPFEFYKYNEIKGFDIELAMLIAKELGKTAKFKDMQFSAILPELQNGSVDAAIATITITEERKRNFDFSDSYYEESMSMVYPEAMPLTDKEGLKKKKIACQLGSTMEIWLKKNALDSTIVLMNNNNQSIEALKADHVNGALLDTAQAVIFTSKIPSLSHSFMAKSENGYGIAVKKGSALKDEINRALKILRENGTLDQLQQKWVESAEWND